MGTRARPCSLSLPFDILSEMRVVEEGGTKESEDIGPSRKKGNYQDIYFYVIRLLLSSRKRNEILCTTSTLDRGAFHVAYGASH